MLNIIVKNENANLCTYTWDFLAGSGSKEYPGHDLHNCCGNRDETTCGDRHRKIRGKGALDLYIPLLLSTVVQGTRGQVSMPTVN